MKKLLAIFVTYVLTFLFGMLIAILLIANGVRLSIPRIEWSTWTENYDLQLNIAADSTEPRGSMDAVVSR